MAADAGVSVVVPVYNGHDTIDACLRSLRAQEYDADALEIIVVDNASTDDTPSILRRHTDRVTLLQEGTRGPAAARNRGLRAARHTLVAMTDADCVADRGWVRAITAPFANPDVAFVGGRILARRPCNAIEAFGEAIHDQARAIGEFAPPYVVTMNWAARRALVERVGYFDESFLRAEDVDFSYRVARHGIRPAYTAEAVVYHRNESTWRGLFAEGFGHGLHSRHLERKHGDYLAALGRSGHPGGEEGNTGRAAAHAASRHEAEQSLCHAVFSAGRTLGKTVGRLRFRR